MTSRDQVPTRVVTIREIMSGPAFERHAHHVRHAPHKPEIAL
jgi:hypothetical protein